MNIGFFHHRRFTETAPHCLRRAASSFSWPGLLPMLCEAIWSSSAVLGQLGLWQSATQVSGSAGASVLVSDSGHLVFLLSVQTGLPAWIVISDTR